MEKPSWCEHLQYKFDNLMSRGTIALISGLAFLSLVLIFAAGAFLSLADIRPEGSSERLTFIEAAWESLMRTLDAGTMGGDSGWGFRLVMFAVTIGGVFIISSLIGVLTSGLEGKLEELRKGHSRVIESGHTVILGWSPQIFSIISELAIANANQTKPCIVILGDIDKVAMEDAIRANVPNLGRTRVVCRSGNPIDLINLELVSLQTARSIIILAAESENPDAEVIKTILAITNNANRRSDPYHIVAEIRDPKNMDAARLVGKNEVELVLAGDLIARIIAQTCRQSGLSVVYTELLDFEGDEIYFKNEPSLIGKTYGEALSAYEDSAVIGLVQGGQTKLNPAMDTIIQIQGEIIAISKDDDTIQLSAQGHKDIDEKAIVLMGTGELNPERTLILGWNQRAPTVIKELDHYVARGSSLIVVANIPECEAEIDRLRPELTNQIITFHFGDTSDRRLLDEIAPATFHHVVVLSYSELLDTQQADALTLITLLHLRDMADKTGKDFPIVSEMLDLRNRTLAEVTQADDFIVSDKLISLILSQVSENKRLNAVFADIFDPEGVEIYLKPAGNYIALETPVDFYPVVESARRRGETAFGYQIKAHSSNAAMSYGVVVNPEKSKPVCFSEGDRIIVLAVN
ncbi:MAG: potassium transporter TrkA [Chloroflexi bacterium]|nr:potassium transporter TrkA [Chloroflexota bacterium]